jgi:hypothetical protein
LRIYGGRVSEKINLNYSGKASLFEGKTSPPEGFDEVELQILAADQFANFGQHTLSFRIEK